MATGDRTPNMSVYKPAPGETVYDPAFSSGLDKIDAHDHTGAPDKGVQIPTDGLVDGCVTPPKLSKKYVDKIIGDQGSGIVPDANDDVTITGDVVANGTHAKPVYHDDTAASASTLDVQLTKAVTVGAKTVNDVGLASFDSAAFAVDASTGHVTLAGGGGSPAVLTIIGDQGSGNVPDGSGQITITGDVVANGTNAKAVYLDDTAANASTLDVQLATAVAAASAATTDVGLASFDSANFAVDSNGNVTLTSGAGAGGDIQEVLVREEWLDLPTTLWSFASSYSVSLYTESGNPGILRLGNGGGGAGTAIRTYKNVVLGDTELVVEFYAKLSDASFAGAETVTLGLVNSTTITDGVYFRAEGSSANWRAYTTASSTSTNTDTSTATDTDWHTFKFVVNAAASSIEFFIDGSSVATNTTNIPTSTNLGLFLGANNLNEYLYVDALLMTQTRGT